MTHDPDHDQRAMSPEPGTNGLHDPRLSQAYREAQRRPHEPQGVPVRGTSPDEVPWELRGARSPRTPARRRGPSTTTRVLVALVVVIAMVATLVGRW